MLDALDARLEKDFPSAQSHHFEYHFAKHPSPARAAAHVMCASSAPDSVDSRIAWRAARSLEDEPLEGLPTSTNCTKPTLASGVFACAMCASSSEQSTLSLTVILFLIAAADVLEVTEAK